jgi:hypothetical protein
MRTGVRASRRRAEEVTLDEVERVMLIGLIGIYGISHLTSS